MCGSSIPDRHRLALNGRRLLESLGVGDVLEEVGLEHLGARLPAKPPHVALAAARASAMRRTSSMSSVFIAATMASTSPGATTSAVRPSEA